MEKLEMELIRKLQHTQLLQKAAYEELESALSQPALEFENKYLQFRLGAGIEQPNSVEATPEIKSKPGSNSRGRNSVNASAPQFEEIKINGISGKNSKVGSNAVSSQRSGVNQGSIPESKRSKEETKREENTARVSEKGAESNKGGSIEAHEASQKSLVGSVKEGSFGGATISSNKEQGSAH